MVPAGLGELKTELGRIAAELTGVVADLREIARGIHPAVLSEGGLRPALKTLARRAAIAVRLNADVTGRLPEQVEVAAYYVVSEARLGAHRAERPGRGARRHVCRGQPGGRRHDGVLRASASGRYLS
jgi:signal transduction histidine kinase